jgi:CheY-like chemotaxis protein
MPEVGNILLVEHDAAERRRIARAFVRTGWQVTEAPTGAACLAVLRRSGDFVVLLDLGPTDMDGRELLARIAAAHPDDLDAVSILGDILRSQEKYEPAIEAYTKALAITGGENISDWRFYYIRGIAYERAKIWDKAEAACREVVERLAEDIRLSLTFYRTEYDRESLPRYALGGWVEIPLIGRWLSDRLGLNAPFESMDPLKAVEVMAAQEAEEGKVGTQFLQSFGLALRGL